MLAAPAAIKLFFTNERRLSGTLSPLSRSFIGNLLFESSTWEIERLDDYGGKLVRRLISTTTRTWI